MIDTWEKVLDPNFINAEIIGDVGAERVVTIKDIDFKEAFDQKTNSKVQKQSLFFEECKPMILNKTNTKTLMKLFGADGSRPRDCVGKKVILYVVNVKVGGKVTTGIRIKEYMDIRCESCGNSITATANKSISELVEISRRNTRRTLCLSCMREFKKAQEKEDNADG